MLVRNACEFGSSRAAAVHVNAGRVRSVLSEALGQQHCAWRRALMRMISGTLGRNAWELGSSRAAAVHVRAGRVHSVLSEALGQQYCAWRRALMRMTS